MDMINDKDMEKTAGGTSENLPRHSGMNPACEMFESELFEDFANRMQIKVNYNCGMCKHSKNADLPGYIYCTVGK